MERFLWGAGMSFLTAFTEEEQANEFKAFLVEQGMTAAHEASANHLWSERFLPMSIKDLGPSLLAPRSSCLWIRCLLPREYRSVGKHVGVALYPAAHLINADQVLFLALMTSDNRRPSSTWTFSWSR